MNLLENELVKKYFEDLKIFDTVALPSGFIRARELVMAWNVLAAMQEPIKTGDKYLDAHDLSNVKMADFDIDGLHTATLRLPSCFQTPEKKECNDDCFTGTCPTCHSSHSCKPTPDLVEIPKEIIHEIAYGIPGIQNIEINRKWLEDKLTALVSILVRSTKGKS